MKWLFAYGPTTDPERMRAAAGSWIRAERAQLDHHAYLFSGEHPELGGGTSTIVPMPGATVLGVAYLLSGEQLEAMASSKDRHELRRHSVLIDGREIDVFAFESPAGRTPGAPSAEHLEQVWQGLRSHYDPEIVARYLNRAIKRSEDRTEVHARRDSPDAYKREYGSAFRRIFPWEVTDSEPFGSAWAVLEPEEATTPHCHDEEESFIFLSGTGRMTVDGREFDVAKGDAVYLEPFSAHTVKNSGTEPLELLCLWWGEVVPAEAA